MTAKLVKDPTKAGQGRTSKDELDTLASLDQLEALLRDPSLYEAENQVSAQGDEGRRRKYPVAVYVLIPRLLWIWGNFRKSCRELSQRIVWPEAAKILAEELATRDPETPWTLERLLALGGPSAQNYRDARDGWLRDYLLTERCTLQQQAARIGAEMGAADETASAKLARPRRTNVITYDGKVITPVDSSVSPYFPGQDTSKPKRNKKGARRSADADQKNTAVKDAEETEQQYINWRTGQIFGSDETDGKLLHATGKGPHFGHKYIELGSRSNRSNSRIIWDFFRQHTTSEAQEGTDAGIALKARHPGFTHFISDAAMRGTHRDQLARAGYVPVAPKIAKEITADGERIEFDGFLTSIEHGDHLHELHYDGGWVSERVVLSDGTQVLRHLDHRTPKQRADKDGYRLYAAYDLRCDQDPEPTVIRDLLFPTTNDPAELKAGINTAENVLAIPPGSPMYDETYGWREDRESNNNLRDSNLYLRRARSHGSANEDINQTAMSIASNACTIYLDRRRRAAETAAADAGGSAESHRAAESRLAA